LALTRQTGFAVATSQTVSEPLAAAARSFPFGAAARQLKQSRGGGGNVARAFSERTSSKWTVLPSPAVQATSFPLLTKAT
jgi:hypothetical protein